MEVEARIHPTMIPVAHLLPMLTVTTMPFIWSATHQARLLFGQGAGMMPTASAVFNGIFDCARNLLKGFRACPHVP